MINVKKVAALLSICGICAVVALAAALYLPFEAAHAQDPGTTPEASEGESLEPRDIFADRALTPAEWTIINPRTARSAVSDGTTPPKLYETADITVSEGGVRFGWPGFPNQADATGFQIERRILVDSTGLVEGPYRLLVPDAGIDIYYADGSGRPGFWHQYRITKLTLLGTGDSYETYPMLMRSRDLLYGYATANGVQLGVREVDPNPIYLYRFREYTNPLQTNDTRELRPLPTRGGTLLHEPLAPNDYHKYDVQRVHWDATTETYMVDETSNQVVIRVGVRPLAKPEFLTGSSALSGGTVQIDWRSPSSNERGDIALYEVLRRNFREYGSEYEVIGTTTGNRFKDTRTVSGTYYSYAVRAVGWKHEHGAVSDGGIFPRLPAPACTSTPETGGLDLTIELVELMDPKAAPMKPGYGFGTWIMGTTDAGVILPCGDVERTDWFVKRRTVDQHSLSTNCTDPPTSCDVIGGTSDGQPTAIERADGRFEVEGPEEHQYLVWYDAPAAEPGVYRYEYKLCTHARYDHDRDPATLNARLCSHAHTGHWRFDGVNAAPFAAADKTR